jgi:hypothetical protein
MITISKSQQVVVCTENLLHIDQVRELPNVGAV